MRTHASIVIIGGGMAAARLVRKLAELGYPDSIAVVCDEPCFGYNRVLLPAYLCGNNVRSELFSETELVDEVTIIKDNPAVRIDADGSTVHLSDGILTYDRLVLATGSSVPKPECLKESFSNVTTLRSLADADAIRSLTESASSAVVLGGGLLGLETASALVKQGVSVSVVHRNTCLLNRQLNPGASAALIRQLESGGLSFYLDRQIVDVQARDDIVTHVELDRGERLEADLLVLATGTRPNTSLAEDAGLICQRGVVVNDQLQASHGCIFAIGECAEFHGNTCGLVAPVYEQADVLADILTGGARRYQPIEASVRLKVDGVALYSAGEVNAEGHESLIQSDKTTLYRRLTFKDNELLSAVFLGDTRGSANIQQYLNRPVINSKEREQLLFGSLGE